MSLLPRRTVMYIPAVPLTSLNLRYTVRQRAHGMLAPGFPHGGESNFVNRGLLEHLGTDPVSLRSLGLGDVPFPLDNFKALCAKATRELANQMLYANASIPT
jgi:hypothetical protein